MIDLTVHRLCRKKLVMPSQMQLAVFLLSLAASVLPAQDVAQREVALEQTDAAAKTFSKLLSELPQGQAEAGWMLPHRDDQQVVYFPCAPPPNNEFGNLRRFRAKNLLKQAAAASQAGDDAKAYRMFWQAAREDSANPQIMKAIGASKPGEFSVRIQPARNTDRLLKWPARSYLQVLSPHFAISARCDRKAASDLAADLERAYWIWTQVFFPFWKSESVTRSLSAGGRFEPRPNRYRVVVFSDRQEYINTLAESNPGIERSTGFYMDGAQTIFLFAGAGADESTRYHELTHQLLAEATRLRVTPDIGAADNFWVVEGVASYMESLRFFGTFATVGGWESERLQYTRFNISAVGETMPLDRLASLGKSSVQRSPDIATWYSFSAAYTHLLMQGADRSGFLDYVRCVYEGSLPSNALRVDVASVLKVTDRQVLSLREGTQLQSLCLSGTNLQPESLRVLKGQRSLRWLDLAGLPVTDDEVGELISTNKELRQLRLERTKIGARTLAEIAKLPHLEELDLSLVPVEDKHLAAFNFPNLETLWLTGSRISDASINKIAAMAKLQRVDVQSTGVTAEGLKHLREARPSLQVNAL